MTAMMHDQPMLQSADTDGNGTKRRRRPALSCVECRVRKVKCDREKPCGSCNKTKSPTCTYRAQRLPIRRVHGTPVAECLISTRRLDTQPQEGGEVDSLQSPPFSSGSLGGSASAQLGHSNPLSPRLSSTSSHPKDATVSTLLDRIRHLENQLSTRVDLTEPILDTSSDRVWPPTSTGSFMKSKYYGQTHWINAMEPYEALGDSKTSLNSNTNRREVNPSTELYTTLAEVKRMARILKTSRMVQQSVSKTIQDTVPPKETCDQLIDGYFRTFEGPYRVLHVLSFRKLYEEFWVSPATAKPSAMLTILLVCAIGVPFYTGDDQPQLRLAAAKWIQAANEWLSAPHVKSRLNMAGLQIQILTILARQVCCIDGDHVWISAGALLRTSMLLGLHRDPSHFGKVSVFHSEMRRRLWATVLELTVQISLDVGMSPTITPDDYDTAPPSNVNDDQISDSNDVPLIEKPRDVFTDCSVQIAFTRTLPVRLEIVRQLNSLRFDLAYNDAIHLGAEVLQACRENTAFQKSALVAQKNITAFKIKFADCMVRRFVLCLHRPYFARANKNPQYHYSRKVSLDASFSIYAPATELAPGEADDWTRLSEHSVGGFKSFFLFAMSTAYYELNSQIKEWQENAALFTPLVSASTAGPPTAAALPAQFEALRAMIDYSLRIAIAWIRNGGTNAKGVVFLDCALARIDAIVAGEDPEPVVLAAAKRSVDKCRELMANAYREEHGDDINLDPSVGPFAGRDHGRGEGADDITGQHQRTGTASLPECGADGSSAGLDGAGGFDIFGHGSGSMDMDLDFDFNAYLQGQSLSTGSSNHFGRSPEWFYDLGNWPNMGNVGAISGI